jgi:hypothetical protein
VGVLLDDVGLSSRRHKIWRTRDNNIDFNENPGLRITSSLTLFDFKIECPNLLQFHSNFSELLSTLNTPALTLGSTPVV